MFSSPFLKPILFLAGFSMLSCNPFELGRQAPSLLQDDMVNISKEACLASRDGVVGAVRSGIALFRANDLVENGLPGRYPTSLDSASEGGASSQNPFYVTVLSQGVSDPKWTKKGNTYIHKCEENSQSFTYHLETGTFE